MTKTNGEKKKSVQIIWIVLDTREETNTRDTVSSWEMVFGIFRWTTVNHSFHSQEELWEQAEYFIKKKKMYQAVGFGCIIPGVWFTTFLSGANMVELVRQESDLTSN